MNMSISENVSRLLNYYDVIDKIYNCANINISECFRT